MPRKWRETEISAYVDGRLDAVERAALEAALARDAALRARVTLMQQTVACVRAQPFREPPRNYLLTPAMVAEKKSAPAAPRRAPLWALRLSTSLSAALFVIALGLNLLGAGLAVMPATRGDEMLRSAEFAPSGDYTGSGAPVLLNTEEVALLLPPEARLAESGEADHAADAVAPAPEGLVEVEFAALEVDAPDAEAPQLFEAAAFPDPEALPPDVDIPGGELSPEVFPPRWLTFVLGLLTLVLGGVTFKLSRQS